MPSFLHMDINWISLASALGSLLLFYIVSRVYKGKISPLIKRICAKTSRKSDDILINGFEMPIVTFLVLCGVYIALRLLPASFGYVYTQGYALMLGKAARLCFIALIMWGMWRSSDIASIFIHKVGGKLDLQMSSTVTRFMGYIFKVIVLCFAAVIIISELGYDVNGLVAGLGLGGLTFALAAKETASNFFGGLVIILDKPFEIGDWISAGNVEGVVEDVSFRSTKIRTFQNALTIIPNAQLSNEAITNWARMNMRKVNETLELSAKIDTAQLQELLCALREALQESEDIASGAQARLSSFSNGCVQIGITYFTKATEYNEYVEIKEKVNLNILDILSAKGQPLARPFLNITMDKEGK
ncbi:MAG: mechanosensitive ion channel family protein [Oscillospiraceae bacterium]